MNLDWLRSISAKIEGRTAIIWGSLGFCALGIWLALSHVREAPGLCVALVFGIFILAAATVLIGLLANPKPSEPSQKFFVQQVDKQLVYAGGFHSADDLLRILQEAHNIRPLPPPSALVVGAAANEGDYRQLSTEEARRLQRQDEEGVKRMLKEEAERLQASLGVREIAGGQAAVPKEIGVSQQQRPPTSPGDASLG